MTSGDTMAPSKTMASKVSDSPKITVVFLLYSEAGYVPGLFQSILKQKGPMEVIFVDNGSRDTTLETIEAELKKAGSPSNFKIVHFEVNQGISRALNAVFKQIQTPYVLTCHCDVLFGRDDYVAKMVEYLDQNPKAGAMAGQPAIPTKAQIPFAEKVNLVANLMDIFPNHELLSIGFVEGRCDAFRISALAAAGYYDTTLRLAGEDQVMAARMRGAGFELYQAPDMPYSLSVSQDQDSLSKLVKHQRLFGRAHPYIVLMNRHVSQGIIQKSAGANRRLRTILRLSQVWSTATYGLVSLFLLLVALGWLDPSIATVPVVALLATVVLVKLVIFGKHSKAVKLTPSELLGFYLLQPALDISYTIGLVHGLCLLPFSRGSKSIS